MQAVAQQKENKLKPKQEVMVGVRVTKELHTAFMKKVAKERNHNMSTLVRSLIEQYTYPSLKGK